MRRRFLLGLFASSALLLSGCGAFGASNSKDFYFKSIVKATYGGRPIEGVGVMRQPMILSPQGYTRGEAIILNLGNDKRAYLLLCDRQNFSRLFFGVVMNSYRPIFNPNAERIASPESISRLMDIPIGTVAEWKYKKTKPDPRGEYYAYPLVVAFRDESDPASVFLVETEKPTTLFGQRFDFKSITIERVAPDTPLTNDIIEHLPWVDETHDYWIQQRQKGFAGNSLKGLSPMQKGPGSFGQKLNRYSFVSTDRRY